MSESSEDRKPASSDVSASSDAREPAVAGENARTGMSESEAGPRSEMPDHINSTDEKAGENGKDEQGESDRGLLLWVVGVLLVLSIELFIYGRNGDIELCVGLDGVTDFKLASKNRTTENFRRFPQCVQRLNLGMWASSEEHAVSALEEACSRATAMRGPEAKRACIRKENGWIRRVTKAHIPPWDSRLYRRLLWLD